MPNKNIRVIFDTNVWISFLIGKRLVNLVPYLASKEITIVITAQLLIELKRVIEREKLKKYFPKERVKELIELLEIIPNGHYV
jgi:putative PIN family toxin of toxin-antitoxin system